MICTISLFVCLFIIIHSVNPYMVKATGYRICHDNTQQYILLNSAITNQQTYPTLNTLYHNQQ